MDTSELRLHLLRWICSYSCLQDIDSNVGAGLVAQFPTFVSPEGGGGAGE